jgi:serine/threonine protein kinase
LSFEEASSSDWFLKLLATSIEAKTGYQWVPTLTRRGTGSIVLVFDTKGAFPKYVACKTITHPGLREPSGLKVFLREIKRTLRAQGHPLIARVSYVTVVGVPQVSSTGEVYYEKFPAIFMRYYEQNLREYMFKKGVLEVDEALSITIQVVKGLLYLREQGFIAHQDLKPENILVEDLCKGFDTKNIPPVACIRPRVADFGLADAIIEAGIPGGTNPYRAPEQFTKHFKRDEVKELMEAGLFNPDVFALGVILTEMLTGRHPCGLSSHEVIKPEIASDIGFWEKWSIEGARIVKVQNTELRDLILRMLDPNPKNRPTLDEVYVELMKILRSVNPQLHSILETQLSYYDDIARSYKETLSNISVQLQLLKLSTLPEAVELLEELAASTEDALRRVKPPKSPEEVYVFIRLAHALGNILLRLNREKYKEKVVTLAIESLDAISNWRSQIRAVNIPYLSKFSITDYEAHAELASYPLSLLRAVMCDEEVEEFIIERYDSYIRSLYFFDKGNRFHGLNNKLAIRCLEEALKYTPGNEIILYFKALWKYQQALIEKDLDQKCKLLKESIEELEELLQSKTTLREIEKDLGKVKSEYNKSCLR